MPSDPFFPYIVSVTVYDSSNAAVSGITVTARNESTGDVITANTTTDASGRTLLDLGNFNNGFSDGQFVEVRASGSGSGGQNLGFKMVSYDTKFVQLNEYDIKYEV